MQFYWFIKLDYVYGTYIGAAKSSYFQPIVGMYNPTKMSYDPTNTGYRRPEAKYKYVILNVFELTSV